MATFRLNVSADVRKAKRQLSRIERRQVPFATSLALNDTAFQVRKFIVSTVYPNAFPRARNKRFANVAFRVRKSTKRNLVAHVYDRLDRYFLDHHIRGRAKRPRGSSALLIPVNARRTATGRIRKADTAQGAGGTFVADLQGKGPAIYRRRKGRLVMLFTMKQSTPVRPRFDFYRLGIRRAQQAWPRAFDKAMKRALRTAR